MQGEFAAVGCLSAGRSSQHHGNIKARHGTARHGTARHGTARHGNIKSTCGCGQGVLMCTRPQAKDNVEWMHRGAESKPVLTAVLGCRC